MGITTAEVETWNQPAFQRKSQLLAQFVRNDFSAIASELRRVFPNTKGLQERYVPVVQRFAHEMSGIYSGAVMRSFAAPKASATALAKLDGIYADGKANRFWHQVHRDLLVQNTMILAAFPAGIGRVRFKAFAPYQVEWVPSDPAFAEDLSLASSVSLRIPIKVTDQAVTYGRLVMTPAEIYLDSGKGKTPVYGTSTGNPFGRIPLVVLRLDDPLPGRWAAPVNEPLLTMQLALCVSESDTELLVHTQAWGQKVLNNAQAAQQVEEIQVGPDKIMGLINHDPQFPGPSLQVVQGQPPLAQITGWNESRLRLLCSMYDLSPDAFLKVNTAVTASARAYDARDRQEARSRAEPILVDGETEFAQLVADVVNLTDPLKIPRDVRVAVEFPRYEPPVDPLHESQALAADLKIGAVSLVDHVANRHGISRAEADAKITANLAEWKRFAGLGAMSADTAAQPDQTQSGDSGAAT